jgi:4-hydroxythreonine-4-phosphate dehydrogenase
MGDPAGIGSEVAVGAYADAREFADVVVIGDAVAVRDAVEVLGSDLDVRVVESVDAACGIEEGTIPVLDLGLIEDVEYGVVREDYGAASLAYVERAIELARSGAIDAIATAPINKQATRLAGSDHAGHTGLLAERTGVERYSMLLVEGPLRVTHVSTHVSLREAIDRVTTESVLATIEVTADALADLGVEDPTVAVAGLNPHASDGGLMGDREATEIVPAVRRATERGIDAVGPEPPDTVFVAAARGEYDAVVAMYHDQGHIPIKMLGFGGDDVVSGVNVTIGLPIVRTSVDHGTAFDIAGEGVASEASMLDAIRMAARLAEA